MQAKDVSFTLHHIFIIPQFLFIYELWTAAVCILYLIFRNNPGKPIELFNHESNIKAVAGYFELDAPVKILCHGFLSSSGKPFPNLMKNCKKLSSNMQYANLW